MPERPPPPDLQNLLTDVLRRLRAVERQTILLPEGTKPLQTFEDAAPLGDTRFLDFGAGLHATALGDGWVRVFSQAGGASGWDAIVDGSFANSDPDAREFLGIGEALTYLASIGLGRALVLVRATDAGGYTETGNWTNPGNVHLFGVADTTQGTADDRPLWDHAGFSGSNAGWELHDMQVTFGSKATGFTQAGNDDRFYAERCSFHASRGAVIQFANHVNSTYIDCQQDYFKNLGVNVLLVRHHFGDADNLITVTLADTSVVGDWTMGVSISSPAAININLPNFTYARSTILGSAGGNGVVTYANSSSSAEIHIEGYDDGTTRQALSFGALGKLAIRGTWSKVVAGSCTRGADIRCNITSTASDISGPANIALAGLVNRLILRGEAIAGTVSGQNTNGNLGTTVAFLDFVNADGCSIVAALDNNSFTGKPYAFDASSNQNVLVLKDAATFANAGTDAGTGNRVLPEAAPPAGGIAPANADYLVGTAHADLSAEIVVGTTPGGELGGTWAAPTVDATHSGSAHADFLPVAGAPTGWGSITNVTPDQSYDADATTIDEIADVLGTLVADLIARGVLDT